MSKKLLFVVLILCGAGVVWAAADKSVDTVGTAFETYYSKGLYVGNNTPNDTLNRLGAIKTCNPTIDIGAAGAAATVVATGTCTGIALGDVIVGIAPAADDAAFDEGSLTGFAESANTVKLVYHADATGGDVASMVYYITYIKRTPQ